MLVHDYFLTNIIHIHTISVTTSTVGIQPYQPPFPCGNYMTADPNTIAIPPRSSPIPSLPLMASLNLPNMEWLTNNPIHHDWLWHLMPAKICLDTRKFEGKVGEYRENHIMSFNLCCSSNIIVDDFI